MVRIIFAIAAFLIGGATAAWLTGTRTWARDTNAAVAQLSYFEPPARVQHQSLSGLPDPVIHYFRKVLRDDAPIVRAAVATQDAEFFINGSWKRLTATQHFRASPPAFVWDARIGMAPLVEVVVRDSYIDGRGSMKASMLGVVSLANQSDRRELNLGALQRLLGEAIWMPTALLPSRTVSWAPRDERSAIATLRDGENIVSLSFEFDDQDMVRTISGDRYKEAGGEYTVEPWLIRCDDPQERGGMIIPLRCGVSWISNGMPSPYWRGRITSIDYQFF